MISIFSLPADCGCFGVDACDDSFTDNDQGGIVKIDRKCVPLCLCYANCAASLSSSSSSWVFFGGAAVLGFGREVTASNGADDEGAAEAAAEHAFHIHNEGGRDEVLNVVGKMKMNEKSYLSRAPFPWPCRLQAVLLQAAPAPERPGIVLMRNENERRRERQKWY
jgi:hypothetical protein